MLFTSSASKKLFKQRRFRLMLLGVLLTAVLIGLAVVPLEAQHPNATIKTPFDGLYWAVNTLTTVGYGDYVPVTTAGRVLAIILQVWGALLFGVLVAVISTYFSRKQEEFYWGRLFDRLNKMEEEIGDLRRQSGYLIKDAHKDEPTPPESTPSDGQ